MRILLVNSEGADLTRGGAERYVSDLAQGLEQRGHEVHLLSAFPVAGAYSQSTHTLHGLDWRRSRSRRYRNHVGDWVAAPWSRFEELLRQNRPDLVHTSNLPGIGTGIWERARRLGIPVVHTLHDYHLLCPRSSLTRRDGRPCQPSPFLCGLRTRRLARWSPGVSVVIGVSEYVLNRHRGFFSGSTDHVVIRHPLVAVEGGDQNPPRSRLSTLGYLGSLTTSKGVDVVLEASAEIARMGVSLRVAGEGPLRAAVVAAEGVQYEGHLTGPALREFLLTCDAGVIPSVWEEPGLTFVLCEWLGAKRPVLATRRGALAEAGLGGGVVPIEPSAAELTAAVSMLRDERHWRRLLESMPAIEDAGDVQRWLDQHEAAYELALTALANVATA